jgi:hypothetical protein
LKFNKHFKLQNTAIRNQIVFDLIFDPKYWEIPGKIK